MESSLTWKLLPLFNLCFMGWGICCNRCFGEDCNSLSKVPTTEEVLVFINWEVSVTIQGEATVYEEHETVEANSSLKFFHFLVPVVKLTPHPAVFLTCTYPPPIQHDWLPLAGWENAQLDDIRR